jgi:C1A family cysteine protease
MKKPKRVYRLVPDLKDKRDLLFHKEVKKLKSIPLKLDMTGLMSPVEDQGQLGSCTANAFAGALEFLGLKLKKFFNISRLFIYFNERIYINTVNEDSGANLRDGIKSLVKYGACSESIWPYIISKFKIKPPKAAYDEAKQNKITKYLRILSIDDIKQAIAQGIPVVFGISVYQSFESATVEKTGTVPTPKKGEKLLGGHAMLVVGYDDTAQRFIVRNSWGRFWGKKGYCTLTYTYMKEANDMWAIVA